MYLPNFSLNYNNNVDNKIIAKHLLSTYLLSKYRIIKKNKRRMWSNYWLLRRNTPRAGSYNLLKEMAKEDPAGFHNFTRMNVSEFNSIVAAVTPMLVREHTRYRTPISVGERVAVTLRYLASGLILLILN